MSKILIAIPIYNEQASIKKCIESLISIKNNSEKDNYEILCVDDGSTDSSLDSVRNYKNDILFCKSRVNQGLSEVFNSIMHFGRDNDFDYLIIFDADNQYPSQDITNLVEKVKKLGSDIHIGSRNFNEISHFSLLKKLLQKIGSRFISFVVKNKIIDATSGFRVYSKKSMEKLFSTNSFTYTLETLLQSNTHKLKVTYSIISNSYETRDSRLFKNNWEYLKKSFFVIIKSLLLYKNSFLNKLISLLVLPGLYLISRFLIPYITYGTNPGNMQSLILGTSYLIFLFLLLVLFYIFSSNYQTKSLLMKMNYMPKHKKTDL